MSIWLMSILPLISPVTLRPLISISTYLLESPFIIRYEPMAFGEKEREGTIMVMACWKSVIPARFISLAVMTDTGAGVFFSRWCVPVPVTTTGFKSTVLSTEVSPLSACAHAPAAILPIKRVVKNLCFIIKLSFVWKCKDMGKMRARKYPLMGISIVKNPCL